MLVVNSELITRITTFELITPELIIPVFPLSVINSAQSGRGLEQFAAGKEEK